MTYEDNVHVLPAAVSASLSNFQFHAYDGHSWHTVYLAYCMTLAISMCLACAIDV